MSLIDTIHKLFSKEDVLKTDVEEALKALEARFTPVVDNVTAELKTYIQEQWAGLQAELVALKATIENSLAEKSNAAAPDATPVSDPAEAPAATDVAVEQNSPPVVG